jgi:hypothetical protein
VAIHDRETAEQVTGGGMAGGHLASLRRRPPVPPL